MMRRRKYIKDEPNLYGEVEKWGEVGTYSETDIHKTDKQKNEHLKSVPFSQSKIQSTFDKLIREERKTMRRLMKEVEKMETHKKNINELKKTLRRIHDYIKWGYDDITRNVNVDCKIRDIRNGKGKEYIRGRINWDGGYENRTKSLREISGFGGRIPKVIDDINECIRDGENGFPKKELKDEYKSKCWDEIKDDKKVMGLIQKLGKVKFRNQLFNQFLSRRTLGMRIRTKDMMGYSKHYDKTTLSSKIKPNHIDLVEMDEIIKNYKEKEGDTFWYKNVEKWLRESKKSK